jgi:thiamine kinase-like enzyme
MLDAFNLLDVDVNRRSEILRDFLVRIFQTLIHFRESCGFRHYDLHSQNIMTTADAGVVDNLKLIDFGLSYIRIGDVEIGVIGERFEDGYNLSSFAWMMEGLSGKMKTLLNNLQDYPDETKLEVYLEELKTKPVVNVVGGRRKTRRSRSRSSL